MHDTVKYRQQLVERIHLIHAQVKATHALPNEIETLVRSDKGLTHDEREGWLRLFFLTAKSWTIWQYTDQLGETSMHKGMAFITGAIDMEYGDESAREFVGYDFTLPTLAAPAGRDWRVGIFDFHGRDTDAAPLDVDWNAKQLHMIDDEDAEAV